MTALPKKAHWPPFYIYLQTIAIALLVWSMTYARYQDDSFITLVYARNLLAGHGLTWNPGEYVEGYTNFLFLMLIAGLGWLGMDLVLASKVVSFVGYFGLVAVLVWYTQTLYRRRFAASEHAYAHRVNAALCVSLVASAGIVLAWCFGGLEGVFFAFLLTASVCGVLHWLEFGGSDRGAFLLGIIFGLCALTRPEGIIMWGITGLFLGFLWLKRYQPDNITFRRLLLLAAGFLMLFVPFMAWRLWYFGEWLPNTVVAKVYGIRTSILWQMGIGYLLLFMITPPNVPIFAVVLLCLTWRQQRHSTPLLYLLLVTLVFCFNVVYSGGDHMPYLRFFTPVVPLIALLVYYCNAALIPPHEKWFRDICGALIVLSVFQFVTIFTDEFLSRGAISGEAVADYVNNHWPKDSLIAINPAGALPYYAPDYRYIDMLGLMDKHIAHRIVTSNNLVALTSGLKRPVGHLKGDGAYVLSRRPDYIMFGDAWGDEKPRFLSDRELATLPEFTRLYERVEVYIDPPANLVAPLEYEAKKNAESLKQDPNNPYFVRGPVMNDRHQLRFIYYHRRK